MSTPFPGNISFNAQHSPMGAFMSFTCGNFGTRGGIGAQIGRPANQDLFIGVKDGDRFSDEPLMCLPFYDGALGGGPKTLGDVQQTFLVEQGVAKATTKPGVLPIQKSDIHRHYRWATDSWHAHDFEFAIYTPFGPIPDPSKQSAADALLPAIVAELVVHNRSDHVKTACFAMNPEEPGLRMLDEGVGAGRVGFAIRRPLGILAELEGNASPAPFPFMRFSVSEGLRDRTPVHLLGTCPGIGFEIPPGESRSLRIAIGCYFDGIVTTRLEGKYLYTRYYSSLTDVLSSALDRFSELEDRAAKLDHELMNSGLSEDQQFLIAHSTRSYYGSTQLLDVAGQPFWVVNEGEYCMMNTLDLCVDQVFWELKQNPWVVKNALDNFVKLYSYHDQVKDPKTGQLHPGGISFCHDMGGHNNFSAFENSSYELADLNGCFSYMTQEQLCNWILVAASYVLHTEDWSWARSNVAILKACVESMHHRDGYMTSELRGLMQRDSSQCGIGQEITTYDSLDESLGQARNNLYLAVKCLASYQGLGLVLSRLSEEPSGDTLFCIEQARRSAETIARAILPERFIPAVLERENRGFTSRILAAIEGLVYPLAWSKVVGIEHAAPLIERLREHTVTLLKDPSRRNLFPDGGLKLSSTSNNSWMSKIAIFQHVAREVFHLDDDPKIAELLAKADAAHVKWETEGSSYWAMCDQIVSGIGQGSKYYPRCITTALWLDGRKAKKS